MASPLVVANNVAAQLTTNIGPSDTAILLASGQGARFPVITPGQYYYATLVHLVSGEIEVVKVTARTLDTLTVERGEDLTTATSFVTGSVIEMRECAQIFREIDWRTNANAPGGAALLDGGGFVADAQIPSSITRDTELAAAIASVLGMIPGALGYTPVQQGTGVGQGANAIKIGWKTGSKLGLTVDLVDSGNFAMEAWVTALRGAINGVASLDGGGLIPIGQIPAMGYLPLAGGTLTGAVTSNSGITTTADMQAANFKSGGAAAILGTASAGSVYLRPNGIGSATGQLQLASTGIATAVNFTATSDSRLKKDIALFQPRASLIDAIEMCRFTWIDSGVEDVGVIAQEVRRLFPEYVHEDAEGFLSVDKASLTLECVVGLAARLHRLELILLGGKQA